MAKTQAKGEQMLQKEAMRHETEKMKTQREFVKEGEKAKANLAGDIIKAKMKPMQGSA